MEEVDIDPEGRNEVGTFVKNEPCSIIKDSLSLMVREHENGLLLSVAFICTHQYTSNVEHEFE